MKKAKILSGVLLLCFSSPLISQAATLDVRGGYRSGSHAYETRLKVSEGWQNGWWASMESNTWNTIHDNKKENAALNDVQVEVNYAIKLDDQWTVRPGMLTHFSSNGTRYGPYVKLSWDATKDLNFGIRYRYDWKAYRQQDLSGDMSRDNVHRWWICPYISRHLLSLNPLQARCRRYSR
uniref:oligogalacturonate-specific porin KdgM family protein n=1 Tax=Escherichia coli TaxID=562 RepID=UPI0021A86DFC